jgi:DNA (cytosine-5)-methyltransferase 1
MENVAALVSQKFLPLFNKWQAELAGYGYTNFAQVLNAKDYGIPQNRERIFLVSVLGEAWYNFPQPFKLEKRLKDVLETNVDEKYYLSDKIIAGFDAHKKRMEERGNGFGWKPTDGGDSKSDSYPFGE